ncbi:MAG: hypothetical protein L3J41_10455 [Melioribacteraceae bacterium]|nr:hypothetical protein [Melioribacteraceae bacterium]
MDDLFFNERYALVLEMAPSNSDILYWGQVWKSTNDGDSWSKISTGLPEGRPKLILDSNIGTPGNRTLYCCSLGNGVYKTTNSGETWTEINT